MIEKIKKDIHTIWNRFPISISFATLLTIVMLYCEGNGENMKYPVFYLSMGTLISYFLHLVTEDFDNPKGNKSVRMWMFCHVALIAYMVWLAIRYQYEAWPSSVIWLNGALILFFVIGCLTVPFRKEKDDNQFWNFTWKISIAGMIAFVAAGCTFASVLILWEGFLKIFEEEGVHRNSIAMEYMTIVCFVYLPILVGHILTPKGEKKHNPVMTTNKILSGFSHYLLLPIVCLYLLVLYGYELKILFTWELPNGEVSLLVSTLMALVFTMVAILYPSVKNDSSKFDKMVVRVIPLMTLPLLLLMSVGIIRRFLDYGMTPERLYIATLNIWFYVMAILLALGRMKRVSLIPISFTLILVLTSAQPFNYNELCRRHMLRKIHGIAVKYDLADVDSLTKWVNGENSEDKETFQSCIAYLDKQDFQEDIVETLWRDEDYTKDKAKDVVRSLITETNRVVTEYVFNYTRNDLVIPIGYKEFRPLRYDDNKNHEFIAHGKLKLSIDGKHIFVIDLESLKETQAKKEPCVAESMNGEATIVLTRIDATIYNNEDYLSINGYLFRK